VHTKSFPSRHARKNDSASRSASRVSSVGPDATAFERLEAAEKGKEAAKNPWLLCKTLIINACIVHRFQMDDYCLSNRRAFSFKWTGSASHE
jgi:hypothetical protein